MHTVHSKRSLLARVNVFVWLLFYRPLWKFNYNLLFVQKYFERERARSSSLPFPSRAIDWVDAVKVLEMHSIEASVVCTIVQRECGARAHTHTRSTVQIQQWLFTFPFVDCSSDKLNCAKKHQPKSNHPLIRCEWFRADFALKMSTFHYKVEKFSLLILFYMV